MLGENREIPIETEVISGFLLNYLFVLHPLLWGFFGALILLWTLMPSLIAYNYLRGMQSPIDQYVLALLGSDISRLAVLFSAVIGIFIGLFLSHRVTKKIDTVKREGEVYLSFMMYVGLFFWYLCTLVLHFTISLTEMGLLGFPTSRFLSNISWIAMSGYFVAFGIPVLLKYILLHQYAKSIDSQVKLVVLRSGRGRRKRFHRITLKLVPSGPDP